jgi:hypothetical protein
VGVAGDHQADVGRQPGEDRQDVAFELGAGVLAEERIDLTALMQQQNDRVGPLRLELRRERVGGLGLVGEMIALGGGGRSQQAGVLQRHPDEADLDRAELANGGAGEQRLSAAIEHVRGQVGELCALEGLVEAARHALGEHRTAALLHALELTDALVEFVVADRGERQAHPIERHDRRLVEKIGRGKRARADEIAGGDGDRFGMALTQMRKCSPEARGPAELRLHRLAAGVIGRGALGHLDVAMEIVDRENLDFLARRRRRWSM